MRVVLTRSLAVVALLLLVAELGTRAISDELPTPMRWGSAEEQVKADDLHRLSDRPGGTVFLGSSMMDAAVDPAQFSGEAGTPEPAYNAALLGADTRIMRLWAQALVEPVADPSVVVVGISCREVTVEAAQDAQLAQFVDSRAMRERLGTMHTLDRVDDAVGSVSALVRHRVELREPLNLTGRERRSNDEFTIGPEGRDEHFLDRTYPPPDKLEEVLYRPDVSSLDIADDKVDALSGLVDDLEAGGAKVWVVNMPITQDFVEYMPTPSEQNKRRCWDLLEATATSAGVEYLEAGVWDKELFADPIHLNREGSRRFTSWLAERVAGTSRAG